MGSSPAGTDWSFARRPFWLFSHVFAATVVVSFVFLGLWQLNRHHDRAAVNEQIEARSNPPALTAAEALGRPAAELDYQLVSLGGSYGDGDFIRVANRTQGGVAGQHLVALFELDDGQRLLVNRGFVPLGMEPADIDPAPSGPVTLTGWLRLSQQQGWLGATDAGVSDVVPRLDVAAIAARVEGPASGEVVEVWLQLAGAEAGPALSAFPDPVPLPTIDGGPHLSYMAQWFIFATLGVLFYGALLRRMAKGRHRRTPEADDDDAAEPVLAP